MPSEPDWSKQISSSNVCTWFYSLAVLNGIFALAGLIGALLLTKSKGLSSFLLISGSLGFINTWALFIVCNRGINTESFKIEDPTKSTRDWYARRRPYINNSGLSAAEAREFTEGQGAIVEDNNGNKRFVSQSTLDAENAAHDARMRAFRCQRPGANCV